MLKSLLNKLKGGAQELAGSALSSSDKDVMEAMMAGAALVAFADGDVSDDELDMVSNMIKHSEQLSEFGDDATAAFNKYVDQLEKLGRMGKRTVMKEIEDIVGDINEENRVRVLLISIEVAYADDVLEDVEEKVLKEIAGKLDLKLSDFL